MSNELGQSPKVVLCPTEIVRTYATNFEAGFNNSNISYFVNVDFTTNSAPNALLCGDRNISPTGDCLLRVATNRVLIFGTDMHKNSGNVLLGDGIAQESSEVKGTGELLAIP
jgi:hypothetical protein